MQSLMGGWEEVATSGADRLFKSRATGFVSSRHPCAVPAQITRAAAAAAAAACAPQQQPRARYGREPQADIVGR